MCVYKIMQIQANLKSTWGGGVPNQMHPPLMEAFHNFPIAGQQQQQQTTALHNFLQLLLHTAVLTLLALNFLNCICNTPFTKLLWCMQQCCPFITPPCEHQQEQQQQQFLFEHNHAFQRLTASYNFFSRCISATR